MRRLGSVRMATTECHSQHVQATNEWRKVRSLPGVLIVAGVALLLASCTPSPPTSNAPKSPQVGKSYSMNVYSHCGIEFVRFGDRYWQTDNPVPQPGRSPYTPGTMTLVDQNTLKFTVDADEVPAKSIVVYFHPTTERPPPCA